ncbi:MAG TPA: thiamine phosphate synthase [Terriglobales bacterium]|nr:thiamine phosphate synthase [Terriglobales bacterium]
MSLFLYYITDRKQFSNDEAEARRKLLERVEQCVELGIDAIQLREKDLDTKRLLELASEVAQLIQGRSSDPPTKQRTLLLINSRSDLALASNADGVHLRADDISAADARAVWMSASAVAPVVAVSCHSAAEVDAAESNGANFAVFGPVFGKRDIATPGTGLPRLESVCRKRQVANSTMPVLALGGVTIDNAGSCIEAGAAGVAGISLFQSGNLRETIERLRNIR